MDPALLSEVKVAVELSMKGDAQSVMSADKLLSEILPSKPGYLPSLLTLAVDSTADANTRKAAAILFGKECKFNWKKISEQTKEISESDKALIRVNYFEGLVQANDQSIIRLLGHALYNILVRELDTWKTFEQSVYQLLTVTPSPQRIYCALVCLQSLVKVKQYLVNEDRVSITKTAILFLPTLLELGSTLVKDLTPVNAVLTKEVCKIYFRIVRIDLDDYLRTFEVNDAWMDLFDSLFVKCILSLRNMQEAKVDEHTYFTSSYWGIFKWILRSVKRYAFRYGDPDKESEEHEPFAKHWMQKYSESYWVRLTEVLHNRKVIHIPEKILVLVISIIFNLFDSDIVLQKHSTTHQALLLDTMLDLVRFTKEEEQLFNDNPVEYFRKNDENNPNFGPAGQALQVFGKSFKRKEHLKAFMRFVNQCLTDKINPRTGQPVNAIDIEAFFHIIETHSIYVIKIKNCSTLVTGLLENFVLPELVSPHGFMRMRACKMVNSYASSTLPEPLLRKLADGVIACIKDKALPVRSCAAQALEILLKKKELRDHFLPALKELLTTYMQLINEFENDTLIGSLKGIFEMYSEVIGPYALDLVRNLSELFFKCLDKEDKAQQGDDDDSEKDKEVMESGFACQGCLTSIEEILRSELDPTLLPQLYLICEPIFEYSFSEKGLDFLGEAAGILNMFVYSLDPLPDGLWAYFVTICYAMQGQPTGQKPDFPVYFSTKLREIYNNMLNDDWASEFLGDLSQILRNFVNKGDPFLFTAHDCYGQNLADLLISTLIDSLKKNLNHDYSYPEVADSLTLLGFILAQHPSRAPTLVGRVLDISLEALAPKAPSQTVRDCFIHNLGCALAACPLQTLEYLNSKGLLARILESWPDTHKRASTYRVRKASFLGMLSLLSLTPAQLSAAQIPIVTLFKVMVVDLPVLAKQQQRLLEADYEDSEDDDDLANLGHEDEEDQVDVDLDEPDHPHAENKHHKKRLDHKIAKTHQTIDQMQSDTLLMEKEEAREALGEIEDRLFLDASDKSNEVLLFETTIGLLPSTNPQVAQQLEAATDSEMRKTILETVQKVKDLIDSK